ncbi:phage tail protein [Ruminococcaceae bacterium OttesenSCG-928-L11]|nr:phage tail protein [Ruminococcaceae bacterium OttesenSCG-928-L11]
MAINVYPFKKYNYRLEIDGIDQAAFSEVSGFDASVDVIEYREGTETINSPRKMPGLTKYGNVTLKWGMSESLSFYEWVAGISSGEMGTAEDRVKDITIYLQDDAHNDIANWTFFNAWPCKYTAPDFNASSSEIAFESVELAFEEMKRNQ